MIKWGIVDNKGKMRGETRFWTIGEIWQRSFGAFVPSYLRDLGLLVRLFEAVFAFRGRMDSPNGSELPARCPGEIWSGLNRHRLGLALIAIIEVLV